MKDFLQLMPEIVLALTMAFVVAGEISYYGEKTRLVSATALLGLVAAFVQTVISYQNGSSRIFSGALSIDGFSLFMKLLFIVSAGFTIASLSRAQEIAKTRRSEYCALILAATLAMCLLSSASDLILIFLSFLFLNVISYFLAAYSRNSVLSTEAAVKFLTFGAVSSAFLLYSFAFLFAFTHSLGIYEMHKVIVASPLQPNVSLVVFFLLFLSLCFQIGAFPMYLFVPDLLEGAPTPVSAFLALGSRAAGFAVAIRFLITVFAQPGLLPGQWQILGAVDWTQPVAVIAGLSMIVGSLLALRQSRAKRMIGYLAVVETGFLLLGLLVLDEVGVAALLYNLVIELFSLIGSFYVVAFFISEVQSDRFQDLRGMMKRAVLECICLVVFLLSLVGSPPMFGFIGKFALIGVSVRHHHLFLAMVAVAAIVLSTVAVARLFYVLVGDFQERSEPVVSPNFFRKAYLASLMIPLTLAGVFADFVFNWAGQSLGFIFW